MKFCVTDFWIPKLNMTGVFEMAHLKFLKIFSIFRVRFEQNLNRILKIVRIEIANTKCHTWGRIECVTSKFFDNIFLCKSMLYLHTGID